MKGILTVVATAALLAAAPAFAQQGAPQQAQSGQQGLNAQDQRFLKETAQGNMAEVEMGKLASERGQNETVKEFGRWMASTHAFANRELTTITQRMHGQTAPATLDSEAQSTLQNLRGLSGAEFDKAYLQTMAEDHTKDIQAFTREVSDGQDYLVKTFAQNMLPALNEHLAEVQDLQRDLFKVSTGVAPAAAANVTLGAGGMTGPAGGTTPK